MPLYCLSVKFCNFSQVFQFLPPHHRSFTSLKLISRYFMQFFVSIKNTASFSPHPNLLFLESLVTEFCNLTYFCFLLLEKIPKVCIALQPVRCYVYSGCVSHPPWLILKPLPDILFQYTFLKDVESFLKSVTTMPLSHLRKSSNSLLISLDIFRAYFP
jgi:hypothetical protein